MTTTMQLIAKQTVGAGGAASVTFSNIPQTYTDLKVVMSAKGSAAGTRQNVLIQFNGSGSSFAWQGLYGYGSTAGANSANNNFAGNVPMASNTANAFGTEEIYIPNYTSTTKAKSIMTNYAVENNGTNNFIGIDATYWNPGTQDNIDSITLSINSSGDFVEYSTFYLYGISNNTTTQATTVPYASGGDVITTDGTYWYHAFKYSGSFTPLKNLTADVLVVAGGGSGGGRYASGGGGAGGYRVLNSQALISATNYTCAIGAGGASQTSAATVGNAGSNSSFAGSGFTTITSTGGGAGGSSNGVTLVNATTGGSGGGGAYNTSGAAGNAGSYSPIEGYAGANGSLASTATGGGGGGAGGAGANTYPGAGGAGSNSVSSWASATSTGVSGYYAGGGGGGTDSANSSGGSGGGGAGGGGGGTLAGATGVANTGSGGGGAAGGGSTQASGAGGSGIIIVRYAV